MKTGILGGTFNPVHKAHLAIAAEVQRAFSLDRIIFIPAAEPPHKEIAAEVSFHHRYKMVELAIKEHPGFEVSDLEIQRSGKSFSVDTLDELRKESSAEELFFIIGMDSFRDIASWKDFSRIFSLCQLVVTTRPGVKISNPLAPLPVAMHDDFCYDETAEKINHKSGNCVYFLSETQLNISSTRIRELLHKGQPTTEFILPAVADYITEHNLYRTNTFSGSQ